MINVGGSDSTTWDSQKVDCTLCHRKYTLITVTDYSWIKRKLLISELALENLRAFGLSPDLDALFTHSPLITRIRKDTLHLVFSLQWGRVFMDCRESSGWLYGVAVEEV